MAKVCAVILIASLFTLQIGVAAEQISVSPTADVRNLKAEAGPRGAVIITFDLVAGNPKAIVTLELQAAGGLGDKFDVSPRSLTGDIGAGIRPGPSKRIVWDAANDIEDVAPEHLRFRLAVRATPVATVPTPDPRGATSRGVVTIVTMPTDALVALDGRPLGLAPLEIRGISAGQHRISASRAGYTAETRLIKIDAGESTRVEIEMSDVKATAAASVEKGGNGRLLALIGGGAAAAAVGVAVAGGGSAKAPATSITTTPATTTTPAPTTTPTTTSTNRPPTVTCGNVVFAGTRNIQSTDVGVVSATRFQFFIAAASDVDGDSLSYTIAYGNGVSSTGTYSATNNSATYIYPGAGTYSPSVTVRDAKGGEAGCRYGTVLSSTVAGEWIGNATTGAVSSRLVLSQSGINVSGNYYEDGRTTANSLQGTLTSNVAGRKDGAMTLSVGGGFNNQLTFSLEPSDDLKSYTGTYTYRGRTGTFTMRK